MAWISCFVFDLDMGPMGTCKCSLAPSSLAPSCSCSLLAPSSLAPNSLAPSSLAPSSKLFSATSCSWSSLALAGGSMIKIGSSNHMEIHNVNIGTGDDCIAILDGTTNLEISNVNCGPGHGISVGSLGRFKNEKSVQGLIVRDSIFNGTSNGVRIKTWASSASRNLVSNFLYKNLQIINVENPINIDQRYCSNPPCSHKSASHVQIKDVKFNNIWGTSMNKVAVNLQCSEQTPCKDVELVNVNLVHHGPDGPATALCENVSGWTRGKISPQSCIR